MKAHVLLLGVGLLSAVSHVCAATAASQTPEYAVIDLGTLGGTVSHARDINEHGHVAGVSRFDDSGRNHAFLYADGLMQDLGALNAEHSEALGINDYDEVVGVIWNDDFSIYHAFLYSNGSMEDLGTLSGKYSIAFEINNASQVVGWSRIDNGLGSNRAFMYENGVMRNLGRLPGGDNSEAFGINNAGQVVGASTIFGFGRNRAFLLSDGVMENLGTRDGNSQAYAINELGDVVGEYEVGVFGDTRAFLYSNGSMKNLGTLGGFNSYAYAINDQGQIVGKSTVSGRTHAFLYADGSMRDLNDLIDSALGWVLTKALAINNAGQIVGSGRNSSGQEHGFLLNPLPETPTPDWQKAIEKPLLQPTYGTPPTREPGKDSLIVVTHGWQPAWEPVDIAWVDAMTNAISKYLVSQGLINWQVHAHRWVEKASIPAREGGPQKALDNARTEGASLGLSIASEEWSRIHLIGHSVGASLIQSGCEMIKNIKPKTVVHLTFLDAYVGLLGGDRSEYGLHSDWADSYFSRDLTGTTTGGPLDYAYNVDVTWLDPTREPITVVYSTPSGDVSQTCYQKVTSHSWPHKFYANTIPPNTVLGSGGFGFPLSKEGGSWNFATNEYRVGKNSLKILGNEEPPCGLGPSENLLYTGKPIDFSALPAGSLVMNSPVNVVIRGTGFTLKTASPAWMAATIPITNEVNLVLLEAKFLSSGAEGLLSVYFGTNVLGSVDERVTLSGVHGYSFPLPETNASGERMLGFRLDAFSAIQSSVLVTNVMFGFVGVRKPFSLSFTGAILNGLPILQLTGPSGFNYRVETSADLVNWSTLAILVNTNGIVRFTDPTSKNTTARFYRAVVP